MGEKRVFSTPPKRTIIIHPFLIALFPLVSMLAENIDEVYINVIFRPAVIAIGAALGVFVITGGLLKNWRKGALVTSLALFLFFSYGHFYNRLVAGTILGLLFPTHTFFQGFFALAFAVAGWLIIRSSSEMRELNRLLNVVIAVMIALPLFNIVQYEFSRTGAAETKQQTAALGEEDDISGGPLKDTPDIYYLVFDRYSSRPSLERSFGFDNSEFMDYLRSAGFYVAEKSNANYGATYLSLASSLNMMYPNGPKDEKDVVPILQDNKVQRFLKARGYELLHFGSAWPATSHNEHADRNFNFTNLEIDSFSRMFLGTTLFSPYLESNFSEEEEGQQRIIFQFNKLGAMSALRGPKFVFAHILVPHPPYLFDREGGQLDKDQAEKRSEKQNYLEYLEYGNGKIKTLVNQILSNSERPPIIILQADEGFRADDPKTRYKGEGNLELHFGILNAYYLPNVDAEQVMSPSISPINTFRVIFNEYFDTNLRLLKTRNFAVIKDGKKTEFEEVTDILKQ